MIWFIIIAVIVIVLYGIVSIGTSRKSVCIESAHEKEKSIPLSITITSVEDVLPEEIKPADPLIDENEFSELKKCVMQLRTLMSELSRKQRLFDMINEKSIDAGGDRMPDNAYLRQLLKTIFIKDLKHCYEKMGKLFKIATITTEGQCLLFIADQMNEDACALSDYKKFHDALNPIDKPVISSTIKYLSSLMPESIDVGVEGDEEFAFSAMLINFDEGSEYLKRYRSLIKLLATCISCICQKSKDKENEWLKNLKE